MANETPKSELRPRPGHYPDYEFISAARKKFVGMGIDSMSRGELIDFINNLYEALHDLTGEFKWNVVRSERIDIESLERVIINISPLPANKAVELCQKLSDTNRNPSYSFGVVPDSFDPTKE